MVQFELTKDDAAILRGIPGFETFDPREEVLAMVKAFRETNTDTPVVLMGYLNPVEVMGYEAFAEAAADAGVDGVLLVDLPPEEALEVKPVMDAHGLDMIFLVAPTTSDARIKLIGEAGSGYLLSLIHI